MKTGTKITMVFLVSLALCAAVQADELLVPGQYLTIQAAIDDANDGDTVLVADGTYSGPGNHNIDFLGKAITVRSESGPDNCVINCNDTESEVHRGFYFHSSEDTNSVLDGFTITNGYAENGGAIYCQESSPTITNCIISGNAAYRGGGVYCSYNSPTITNCIITGHLVANDGGGIYCDGSSPTITNCTISSNTAHEHGGAIYCREGSNPIITNSILWLNKAPNGPEIYLSYSNVWVSYTDVQGGWPGPGNINADPFFAFSTDYHITPSSPCIDAGTNDPCGGLAATDIEGVARSLDGDGDGNAVADMGAYEYTPDSPSIAVSAKSFYFTWDWPKPDPQTLLIRNCGGQPLHWEIVEDCNWLQVSPTNGISIGQINEVTITVDPNGLTPAVYTCSFEVRDPNASNSPVTVRVTMPVGEILPVPSQDFKTIQAAIEAAAENYDIVLVADGTYTGPGNRDIDFLGKAITVRSESGPENCIIDCNGTEADEHRGFYFRSSEDTNSILDGFTITNGYATLSGAIYCQYSSPKIRNCKIIGNLSDVCSGGIYCYYSSPIITNCIISGNVAYGGGGIYCDGGSPTITNCTISDNIGSGISCWHGNPTITNCTITGNSGGSIPPYEGGGIYCDNSSPTITNCIISGNTAGSWGGGICCDYNSNPTITNCIITGHMAADYGGGICCDYDSSPTITNCIISGNTAERRGGGICGCNGPITNCIIWNNVAVTGSQLSGSTEPTYSCIQDWTSGGPGNIDAAPCFIEPGYWADVNDANIIVEPNDPNAVWINGDYHLKSEGWSWDIKRSRWTYDDVTSRCIDAGNPGSPLGEELLSVPDDPNNIWGQNLRINMGAFGGTAEASIPPYDWAILGDLTNDGLVNLTDFASQAADWLNSADQQPGDLNRDSLIYISDLVLLVEDWLKQTTWHE